MRYLQNNKENINKFEADCSVNNRHFVIFEWRRKNKYYEVNLRDNCNIGMLYAYKWVMRHLKKWGGEIMILKKIILNLNLKI